MPVVLHKASIPSDSPLIAAAEAMEPKIRDAFIRAVEAVRNGMTIRQIADALEAGDANRVIELLGIETRLSEAMGGKGVPAGVQTVREAIQATFAAGAQAALSELPSRISAGVAFDLMNPKTVEFLRQYQFNLIKDISTQTKDAIQQVVARAFQEGGHPYEQAREIRDVIGLTPFQERAVYNYRSALESGTDADLKDALGRALRDGRYDRSILLAIDNQTEIPQARIDKMTERYRERFVQYHAQTIARTESIRASAKGQTALWQQAIDQELLPEGAEFEWEASGDERTCAICEDLDGTTAALGEEFAPGIYEPPDPHPDCRCSRKLAVDSLQRESVA